VAEWGAALEAQEATAQAQDAAACAQDRAQNAHDALGIHATLSDSMHRCQ
jgi:hypothetical protein